MGHPVVMYRAKVEAVRARMAAEFLSLAALSRKSGVAEPTARAMLRGSTVTPKVAAKICKAFNVKHYQELFQGFEA